MDQLALATLVDLLPKPTDPRFHDIRPRIEIVLPDMLHDARLGNDTPPVANQILQKLKLQRLQLNALATTENFARFQVHDQIADR